MYSLMCNTLISTILLLLMWFFQVLEFDNLLQNQNIRIIYIHVIVLMIGNLQIKLFGGLLNL